jgi:signal transduction histidine kinase
VKLPFNPQRRGSLFVKYVTSFVGTVVCVLSLIGATELLMTYRDAQQISLREDTERAKAAALKVEQFFSGLARQIGWETRSSASTVQQRRADDKIILEQTPGIAEIAELDASGRLIFTLSKDGFSVATEADYAQASRSALIDKPQFGAVRFEPAGPRMRVFIADAGGHGGVTIVDLELHYLADLISSNLPESGGYAYIATAQGRLLVQSKASPKFKSDDLTRFPQVAAVLQSPDKRSGTGENASGETVLSAVAVIPDVNWFLFVEQPLWQSLAPVYDLLFRFVWLFGLSLLLSLGVAILLARRLMVPFKAFEHAASRLAAGDFSQPIDVKTGDEIEMLAQDFNRMARQIQDSYNRFDFDVQDRTRKLAQSVLELRALEEVGRSIASSLDLGRVLANIVERASDLAQAEGGAIYTFDRDLRTFKLAEAHGLDPGFVQAIQTVRLNRIDGLLSEIAANKKPIQIPQIYDAMDFPLRAATLAAGFRSALIVPLIGSRDVLGVLIVERREAGRFPNETVGLMQSFANQCVVAMNNAHLFHEVEEKGRQLAIASEHKSQFFANMSHELRTPLNAVLGYAELLLDGLYGDLPDRAKPIVTRMQSNGTHLLGLINDILDLSKMEAGEMSLVLDTYSIRNIIETVIATTGSLAHAKGLKLSQDTPEQLPSGFGDERRLTQVLLNIVSNAIKFTEKGGVTIRAKAVETHFELSIEDTGLGIAPGDQDRIFEAFQQGDNTSTRVKGGTGLGLSISKRFIDMHGGTISVTSAPGSGSIFHLVIPIQAEKGRRAA